MLSSKKRKLILRIDVPNLGVRGDIVEVKPGFSRNYLLPQGIAVPATTRTLKLRNDQVEKINQEKQDKLAAAQEMAKRIEGIPCVLSSQAGKDGKLFGSISTADISRYFKEKGIPLSEAIKELGVKIDL